MTFVYIAECGDGTLYVGTAGDLERRMTAHNAGRGAKYTAGRRPVTLVYAEAHETMGDALRREWAIKRWPRARKRALIAARPASTAATTPAR